MTAGIRRCRSVCIGHAPTIEAKVEAGLTAQRIYQDLVEEQGYAGSCVASNAPASAGMTPQPSANVALWI